MSGMTSRVRALDAGQAAALQDAAWRQVSTHVDGMALGSGIAALARAGIIDLIARQPRITAGEIIERTGWRAGYLHVIFKLLEYQGWIEREGPPDGAMRVRLTEAGNSLPAVAPLYENAVVALAAARQWLAGGTPPGPQWRPLLDCALAAWRSGDDPLLTTVRTHLDGHLAAPILARLADVDQVPTHERLDRALDFAALDQDLASRFAAFLRHLGWIDGIDGSTTSWSLHGTAAALMLPQYWYPLIYLPTLAAVGELLEGRRAVGTAGGPAEEQHLDRQLDIRFSGTVFNSTCRRHFLNVVVPCFARDAEARPRYLVDIGCGDGRLLAETWSAIAASCGRERAPTAVGIDLNRVALAATDKLLHDSGVPARILPGDVTRPDLVARSLRDCGIDCDTCLFVCKSVIHDRDYVAPARAVAQVDAPCDLVFVADDGGLIPVTMIEQSLVDLFVAWKPLIARHGWVVIEAHTVPARVAAAHRGRTQIAILDATHGYSRQYLVDAARFGRAAQRAGLVSEAHGEIGAAQLGHAALTIDHFRAPSFFS
ncbi:MAG TPA: hypothetical protein VGH49_18075, partial [Xanthobacteraceae bacterium]